MNIRKPINRFLVHLEFIQRVSHSNSLNTASLLSREACRFYGQKKKTLHSQSLPIPLEWFKKTAQLAVDPFYTP